MKIRSACDETDVKVFVIIRISAKYFITRKIIKLQFFVIHLCGKSFICQSNWGRQHYWTLSAMFRYITLMQLLSNIFLCGALCYCWWVLNNPPHKPIKIERCEFALHLCIWQMLFLTLHSRFIWSAHVFIERLKCLCKNKCTSFSFFLWFHWSREQTAEERQLWNRCLSASRVAL